ncbi:hypothetical protein HPB48_016283 [Haemaphysalis longicornis]|uniref:Uncharacterized protein n=1 Tax=Haemaphysalis longicornis TaxID=44386 RepID=A0A9J6FT85_HAELO|nr:hypothetical protein HPB48_016283 [Haemaphysalis longicornis]
MPRDVKEFLVHPLLGTTSLPPGDEAVSRRPVTRSKVVTSTRSRRSTTDGVKSMESGAVHRNAVGAPGKRPPGLLALPFPNKMHGPGFRNLLCLVEGGSVPEGSPLYECSHLILGDHVLDLRQRVIRPVVTAEGVREPWAITTAAVAEQVRALRSIAAPGIRLLLGLRSQDVENSYLRLWANRSAMAASANLAYEWVRRTGFDGIALTSLVVGRHTVDIYAEFLKRLRALFREDYLIVFGFFHREDHEHEAAYTENVLQSIIRCTVVHETDSL